MLIMLIITQQLHVVLKAYTFSNANVLHLYNLLLIYFVCACFIVCVYLCVVVLLLCAVGGEPWKKVQG